MSAYYLIDCEDSSLCVIFERSIIFKGKWKKLGIGDEISFYWPEDCESQETYKGTILAVSRQGRQKCTINPKKDLNDTQILYLYPNLTQIAYPVTPSDFQLNGDGPVLRAACPSGRIVVRDNVTVWSSVLIECVGGNAVKISNTYIYGPLSHIGCTGNSEPLARVTGRKAPNGKQLAEIGYAIGSLDFVPIIDELAVSKRGNGYITRWLHYKLRSSTVAESSNKLVELSLKNGGLSGSLNYTEVYDRTKQRAALLVDFKTEALVEQYLPSNGTESFVATRLISRKDLYYAVEQNATSYYETTVPVWSSVASGNWKLVSDAVRDIVRDSLSEIEVWSGTYLALYLPGENGRTTYVNLPNGLSPAQFLFKYVYDKTNKRGVVFVTVNNPHLKEATSNNILCLKLDKCNSQYPQFAKLELGYTYCCSLTDFQRHAVKLGLPIFEDAITF